MELKWNKKWNTNWKGNFIARQGTIPSSGLRAWWDASRTSVGAVASLPDFSGNGYNATQPTGASQPICTANQKNGKNTILFNGSNTLIVPAALYPLPTAANTIFQVSKRNVDSGTQVVFNMASGGDSTFRLASFYSAGAGLVTFRNDNSLGTPIQTSGITTTNYNIVTSTFNGTTGQSIQINNGTTLTNTGGSANGGVDRSNIGSSGASFILTGAIAEIIIYNRLLSSAEISQVNRYLSGKWGIP